MGIDRHVNQSEGAHFPLGHPSAEADTRMVVWWLTALALMVALTAIVGAATRLTGSGLSITEWQPILGIIPPLSEADWLDAFEKYKRIPQYLAVNHGMSLGDFKAIYAWEWAHRLIARCIGVAFLLPFLGLLAARRIPPRLLPRLIVIFALGGAQGLIGWFMVKSGLADRIAVSPYRLALHLGCAVLIFALLIWTALELRGRKLVPGSSDPATRFALPVAQALAALVYLQILAGALVAGNKAGLTYTTWPLMDGRFIPTGLGTLSPWWINVFENITAVQFNHRMLAHVTVALGAIQAIVALRCRVHGAVRTSAVWLVAGLAAQTMLGIATLLAGVPLWLGLLHQAGALTVLSLTVWHLFEVRNSRMP